MSSRKILLGGGLLLALFLVPIPGLNRPIWRELEDAAHGVLFALLAPLLVQLLQRRRTPRPWLAAAVIAAALGLASEALQALTHRDPSWTDLRNDLLGIGAGLLLLGAWQRRARMPIALLHGVAAALLLAASALPLWRQLATQLEARRAWPELLGPATPRALYNVELSQATIERAGPAYRIHFIAGRWPGLTFTGWPRDWRGFDALVLDVENPAPSEFSLGLVLRDRAGYPPYAERFNQAVTIPAGARTKLRFPLDASLRTAGGRPLDIATMHSATLSRDRGGDWLLVHAIRLESAGIVTR
jgi:hypothetical protein